MKITHDLKGPMVNVGGVERMACGLVAGWMLAEVLTGKKPSLFKLAGAAALAFRGFSGHCVGYRLLGKSTCPLP